MSGEDIVKYVRAQGIKWWGHLNRREENKNGEEHYRIESHRNEIQQMSKK
jgi:hypothetical protein